MKILGSDITIYGADEQGKAVVPFTAASKISYELMRRHDITLSFVSDTYITILKGDYVEHDNIRYTVMSDYIPDGEKGRYKYEVEFHAPEILFQNLPFFYVNSGVIEAEWSLTANPSVFIDAVLACIAQHTGETWVKGTITPVDPISLSFSDISVFDALTAIAEACETEWYVRGTTIYLARCEEGVAATLTEGLSVKTITPKDTKEDFCNRVFAFGSTRNLSRTYRNADTDTAELRRRLKMPAGVSFVDSASLQAITNPAPGQIVARVKIFEEVYPKIVCAIASAYSVQSTDQEGTAYTIFSIKQNEIVWDDDYLTTDPLSVHFEDGALAGRDFEVFATKDPSFIRLPRGKSEECRLIAGDLETLPAESLLSNVNRWKVLAQEWLSLLAGVDSADSVFTEAVSRHTVAIAACNTYLASQTAPNLAALVAASNAWTTAANAWYGDESTNYWFEILPKSETIYIPNTVLRPQIGDEFVLYNYDISLVDDQLVPAAELQLQAVAQAWVDELDKDTNAYNVQTMAAYCQTNGLVYDFGQRINIVSDRFSGGSRLSRIIGYERVLANPHDCQYIIGDASRYNRIGALESKVDKIEYQQYIDERSTGQMPRILRTIDNITPSENNVLSSVRSLETFVRRSATGATFEGNGKTFGVEVDADGNLRFLGNIYASGSVSAQGVGVGGSGTSYNRLDTWAAYIPGTTDTWVLSALLGHDLHTRVTALEEDTPNVAWGVPTTDYVPLTVNAISRQLSVHGHGHTFASLASKPTTISGYGITDSLIYEGDARLTNSRTASDVSAWAKAATKPAYSYTEVGAAAASHTHGNITNDGKIGSTASLVIVTGTAGALTAKTAGTTAQYLRGDGSWATPPDTVYVHPTKTARTAGGASHFITAFTSDTLGHVTGITTAAMTKADVEAVLVGNSITSHYHDDRYFQKGELFTKEGSGTEADPYRIRANFPFYGISSVAALGIGSGGGGGTSYDRLDSWTGYDVDQAGWVLSAGLGHDTHTRVLALEASTPNVAWGVDGSGYTPLSVNGITRQLSTNGHTHTKSQITDFPSSWDWSAIDNKPLTFTPSAHTLGSHSDVTLTSPANGNILKYSGSKWVNNTLAQAGIATPTDISTAIDNIEIGGRNLYVNTIGYTTNTPFVYSWTAADSCRTVFDGKIIHCKQPFKAGDIVTIQAESDAMWSQSHGPSAATDGKLGMWVYLCATPNSSTYTSAVFLPNDLGPDKTKFIRTYSLPEVSGLSEFYISMRLNGYSYPSGTAHTANLWNVKLERGNKATDWTPAPEDVQASIATVQTNLDTHTALTNNPHSVTKTQVGLGNVANVAALPLAGGTLTGGLIGTTANFTGNVGIGTTSPSQKLDVAGNINFNTNGQNTLISNYKGANADGYNIFIGGGGQSSIGESGATYKGSYNTANGAYSLQFLTTGSYNTANGYASLNSLTTGSRNTANGYNSCRFTSSGSANTASTDSVFLGYDTRPLADGQTNQIVIGASAVGIGSNSVVLGNDAITTTALKGNVGIKTTTPQDALDVNGNIRTASADGSYMQIGAGRLVWDNTNNAIKVIKSDGTAANFYATGSNTAFGIGSGGGGGSSYNMVTDWSQYVAGSELWVVSAELISSLRTSVTSHIGDGTHASAGEKSNWNAAYSHSLVSGGVHMTATDRSQLTTAFNHSQAAHDYAPSAHVGATGNAHGVASTTVAGFMSSTDKSKLDGIAASANNYTHPTSGVTAGTYKSVTVNTAGHVTGGTNPTTLAGYGITDAMSTSHAANGITATNITNWGTAYGWGNHASVGYLTAITKSQVEAVLTGGITSHNHSFSSITSKPTTVSGYGITDAIISRSGIIKTTGVVDTTALFPYAITTASTAIGFEYNILLNASLKGYTLSQSGSGQLSSGQLSGLFDGNLSPHYSVDGIDPSNPLIILIEGLPNIHTQTGGMFGWTSRYWWPRRYKIEDYNDYQVDTWVTWVDHSVTPASTKDLVVPIQTVGSGAFTKIRITIYESQGGELGSNGFKRWGLSEIFFIHPEAQSTHRYLNVEWARKLYTPRALTIGATAKNFDGSAAVSWSATELGLTTSDVLEGSNYYFTAARVLATTIGAVTPSNTALASGITVSTALDRIQGQINARALLAGALTQDFATKNLAVAGTSITTGMSAMGLATPYAYAHVKGGIITENPNYGVGNAGGTTTQNRAGIVISSNHATNNSVFWISTDATVGNALNIGIGNTFNDTNKRLTLSHNGLLTASSFATANADGAYIQVGPIKILYDAANGAIRVEGNLYATGSNTAFGIGGGAGGGGLITNVYGTSGFGGTYSDVDLSSTFNAYAINSLYTAIQGKAASDHTHSAASALVAGFVTTGSQSFKGVKGFLDGFDCTAAANFRTSLRVLNNAENGWVTFAERYVEGQESEAVINLMNIGSVYSAAQGESITSYDEENMKVTHHWDNVFEQNIIVKGYVDAAKVAPGIALARANKFATMGEKLNYQPGMIRSGQIPRKVVVIGNSMTAHAYNETLGWTVSDFREMAASKPDTGWITLIKKHLVTLNPDVKVYKSNGAAWEAQTLGSKAYSTIQGNAVWEATETGPVTTAYTLDSILDSDVDVVIVQLYENVPDTTGNAANCATLSADYQNLYASIRAKCPNARLYQFCGFWQTEGKGTAVMTACARANVEPIHAPVLMWPRTGSSQYPDNFKCVAGDIIRDADNNQLCTVSASVAGHPNDFGFGVMAAYTIFKLYNSGGVLNDYLTRFILKVTATNGVADWMDATTDVTGDLYYDASVTTLAAFQAAYAPYLKYMVLGGKYSATVKAPTSSAGTTWAAAHCFLEIKHSGIVGNNYKPTIQRIVSGNDAARFSVERKVVLSSNAIAYGDFYIVQ